jgi:DNA-binding MarR family transcriptional regulator
LILTILTLSTCAMGAQEARDKHMNGHFLKNLPDEDCMSELDARYADFNKEQAEVYLHMMRTGSELVSRVEDYLSQFGLSSGRMSILMILNTNEGCQKTPAEIADRCGVTRATVTRLVDGLVADGHIERLEDPNDRRSNPIRLTESGQQLLDSLLPGYFRGIGEIFSPLGKAESTEFIRLLDKLHDHLNKRTEML